ncbi:hypothetical protein V1512DRAFT_268031 [Lipomyces arxii]|uniref:uncharacterized protein n=1 Tax=Lipomyces arxii TaxID=56418 RepID=UPI0034CFA712
MAAKSKNPYLDKVALDDTNDTAFLGESDDEDDEFFFDQVSSGGASKLASPSTATSKDPVGEFKTLADTQERIYISKPAWDVKEGGQDTTYEQGFSMLLLLTNGLGVDSMPNQLLADDFAREGYFVVMPDLFSSDPNIPVQVTQTQQTGGLLGRLKSMAVSSTAGFMTDMWIARHTEERTWPMLVNMVEEIVEIYRPRDICVVGYSFGAKYALKLLQLPVAAGSQAEVTPDQEDSITLQANVSSQVDLLNPSWARLVVTGIICHPSLVEAKDFIEVKKPVLIIAVQDDPLFPLEVVTTGTKTLSKHTVFHDLKWYDRKLPHGFAVKGDYAENKLIDENQAHAQSEIFSWIRSFIA